MNVYLTLLSKNRDYRYLWFGSVVSQMGDWFNLIASAALISDLSGTGSAISYLFLARFLPLFFFSPLAGVLADRYERRHVMIASDLLRAATVLSFLLIREPEHVWLLYALTIFQFALSAAFVPARTAVLANVVLKKELVTANALDSFTWSSMLALGALLGGLVAAVFGIAEAFILDAASFLLSAWLISRITPQIREDKLVVPQTRWLDFVDGLRYLRGAPLLLVVSLVKGAGSLAWGAINVLEVSFAEDIFPLTGGFLIDQLPHIDGGTATLGIIYLVSGLGTGFGPLILRQWLGDAVRRMGWAIVLGFALLISGNLLLGLAADLNIFLLATLIRTVGTGSIWVFSAALLQMTVPDRFRGRVFAFEFAVLTLTQSISTLWAGYAQDKLGLDVRQVAITMSLVGLVTGLCWFWFQWRKLDQLRPD